MTDDLHQRLILARKDLYEMCLARLTAERYDTVTLDFQYIRFDNNKNRQEKQLASVMVAHAVTYCLKEAQINETKNPVNFASQKARALFTKREASGECGELLLYMLMEVILQAPQVLAKMSLKTNSNMEIHGADGVHVRYNGPDKPLDIYLGESKIYGEASDALTEALSSIDDVRKNGIDRELLLATENFKWLDPDAQERIIGLMNPIAQTHNYRIHFVVLIGFTLAPHKRLKNPETEADFMRRYNSRAKKLSENTLEKLSEHTERTDDIIHIFFVPFIDAAEFRKEFVRCLK